jgi:hypothetical protein
MTSLFDPIRLGAITASNRMSTGASFRRRSARQAFDFKRYVGVSSGCLFTGRGAAAPNREADHSPLIVPARLTYVVEEGGQSSWTGHCGFNLTFIVRVGHTDFSVAWSTGLIRLPLYRMAERKEMITR